MNKPALPFAPAAERNKEPILAVLQQYLPDSGTVLEIGSGTGQHVVHFARGMPGLIWRPSDLRPNLPGLRARLQAEAGPNIEPAIELDVNRAETWPGQKFAGVYAANVAHIMAWPEVEAMFAGVARCLRKAGVFCLYGPFHRNGRPTSDSNARFDAMLRSPDNPAGRHQGVRDDRAVYELAARQGLAPHADVAMPANNRILVFRNRHVGRVSVA